MSTCVNSRPVGTACSGFLPKLAGTPSAEAASLVGLVLAEPVGEPAALPATLPATSLAASCLLALLPRGDTCEPRADRTEAFPDRHDRDVDRGGAADRDSLKPLIKRDSGE